MFLKTNLGYLSQIAQKNMQLRIVTIEIQLQKVPRRIELNRKLIFFNNSVFYKNVEIKLSIDTYSRPLISESNIKLEFDVIMAS